MWACRCRFVSAWLAFYSAPEASPIMQRETSPPKLHEYDAYYLLGELDMVALSGLYRQWALYEINFPPDKRTRLMAWSAGLERLAEWVGEKWRASDPSPEMPLLVFLARWVRKHNNIIQLEHAKHWLGRV